MPTGDRYKFLFFNDSTHFGFCHPKQKGRIFCALFV